MGQLSLPFVGQGARGMSLNLPFLDSYFYQGSYWDETSKGTSAASELGLANVGGVFVVLVGGMGIACVIAVCEFLWKSRKIAVDEKVSWIIGCIYLQILSEYYPE
ncbi:hypothetical protein QAD02_013499 [Eretmocerus hayati]|uniref:Uncharacterized protein n=1 Tax=Eretmocerus hayati TaxID=131215 RepID=A0ACC2P5K4_9HYME|nr:hypothetical protein QAD02_013499 [Eretmocerus hayati]